MSNETPAPLSDAEEAQLQELAARKAASEAAAKDAAQKVLRDLCASETMAQARADMHAALLLNPLEVDLSYAVGCIDRLKARYAAA